MIDELRKSINSILYERISSPFYGAFFLSWLVWNWRIFYVTFIEKAELLEIPRFKYISEHLLSDNNTLIWYPLFSSLIIIAFLPFITTGAYWIHLRFRKWNNDLKNSIEQNQLLTLKQSIDLRLEIKEQQNSFESLLSDKNNEIKRLKMEFKSIKESTKLKDENSPKIKVEAVVSEDILIEEATNEYKNIKEKDSLLKAFSSVLWGINAGNLLSDNIESDFISYFNSHEIIELSVNRLHKLTAKGKLIEKLYTEDKINK